MRVTEATTGTVAYYPYKDTYDRAEIEAMKADGEVTFSETAIWIPNYGDTVVLRGTPFHPFRIHEFSSVVRRIAVEGWCDHTDHEPDGRRISYLRPVTDTNEKIDIWIRVHELWPKAKIFFIEWDCVNPPDES